MTYRVNYKRQRQSKRGAPILNSMKTADQHKQTQMTAVPPMNIVFLASLYTNILAMDAPARREIMR